MGIEKVYYTRQKKIPWKSNVQCRSRMDNFTTNRKAELFN